MSDCNSDSDLRRLPVASGGTGRCFHSVRTFFFSSHGCLKLTYSIPHSSWLQHKFLLRPPWILSTVTTWSCITWFVLMPPGFQHERWDAALCFPVMATGWEARCCFVLLLQHCVCILCAEYIYIFFSTSHIFMCLSGRVSSKYTCYACATCVLSMFGLFMCTLNFPSSLGLNLRWFILFCRISSF